MLLLVFIVCTVWVVLAVDLVLRYKRLSAYVKSVPKFPLSMLLSFLRPSETTTELFKNMKKIHDYYDGLTAMIIGPKLMVISDDPVNLKTILLSKDCLNKPNLYRMIPLIADGLVFSEVHQWREDRKNFQTVFAMGVLKKFEPVFNRKSYELTKSFERFAGQLEFNLHDHILESSFNTLLETSFRCDYRALKGSSIEFLRNINRMSQIAALRASAPILHPKLIYRFTSLYAEEKKVVKYLEKSAQNLVLHALEERKTELSTDCDGTKPEVLIDRLLNLEERGLMDRQRVSNQVIAFIAAGAETTPFTVLNTLLLLAMNQTVQDRVYEELRTNIVDVDYIEFNTLTKLDYFDRALKESMRLLPMVSTMSRETSADLKLTECTIPTDTVVIMDLLKMYRNEKIWGPTAMEFDPDRFLPEAVAQRHPFAFIPFSAGPRNCIGNKDAILSIKVMLCHLLLKYKFTTSVQMSDISYRFDFLLKLNNKYMLKLEKRG